MFAVYKASRDEGRELLLSWVAEAIEGNTARSRMQINRAVVSSEGFALNLGSVMCLFCKPFLDPKSTKFVCSAARIDEELDSYSCSDLVSSLLSLLLMMTMMAIGECS